MKKYRSAGGGVVMIAGEAGEPSSLGAAAPPQSSAASATALLVSSSMMNSDDHHQQEQQEQAMAMARPQPTRVVEIMELDDDGDLLLDHRSRGTQQTQTQQTQQLQSQPSQLQSQPPLILHRPIPVRVTEEFYREASEQSQLPFDQVQSALRESHEWHLKYTGNCQQPLDPTVVPIAAPAANMVSTSVNNAATILLMDREGARNPSPFNNNSSSDDFAANVVRSKRSRHNNSKNNWCEPVREEETKEREPPQDDESDDGGAVVVRPSSPPPQKLPRPVAIRVTAVAAAAAVPRDIMESRRRHPSAAGTRSLVSPLSMDDSSNSNSGNLGNLGSGLVLLLHQRQTLEQHQHHPAVIECDINAGGCLRRTSAGAPPPRCLLETTTASHGVLLQQARDGLLHALAVSGGETDSAEFASCLRVLQEHYHSVEVVNRHNNSSARQGQAQANAEGLWLTLTKPSFFDCLGDNDRGDPLYTLARMSFNMFGPSDLICSLQGNFNGVERVVRDCDGDGDGDGDDATRDAIAVPKSLREAVGDGGTVLRTYDVITAFSIEPPMAAYPNAPNRDVTRPIRGTMTTYGYMIPDPENPTRDSVWITGGRIEPHDGDRAAWLALFAAHPPQARHGFSQQAQLLAVKWLMGAVLPEGMDMETGVMEYTFSRPLGGHGFAFIDTLYNDDSLRVVRGHRGTYFVFSRMPQGEGAAASASASSN